jgi:sulfate transporter 4
VEQYPNAEIFPGVCVVRLDAPIYFANVQWMQDKIEDYEEAALKFSIQHGLDTLMFLILDLTPVSHIDSMGAHFLEELVLETKKKGSQLLLCNPSPRVVRMLERSGVTEKLGRENIFVRVHDAVTYCQYHVEMVGGTEDKISSLVVES